MIKRLLPVAALLVLLSPMTAPVFAQDAGPDAAVVAPPAPPDPTADPGSFIVDLFNGIRSGDWLLVGALILSGLVLVLRRVVAPSVPFFGTDEGGVILVFSTGLITSLAGALYVKAPINWALLWSALTTAAVAAGGYSAVKRLGTKLITWIISKFKKTEG